MADAVVSGFLQRIRLLVNEQANDMSMAEVAAQIGASQSALKHWLDGTAPIPLLSMVWLAALTHTSLDWLVYGDIYDRYIITDGCGVDA